MTSLPLWGTTSMLPPMSDTSSLTGWPGCESGTTKRWPGALAAWAAPASASSVATESRRRWMRMSENSLICEPPALAALTEVDVAVDGAEREQGATRADADALLPVALDAVAALAEVLADLRRGGHQGEGKVAP